MSSSLKDPQCVAVRTGKHCSKTTAVLPLTQRVDRLQNCHIFLSSDEPCWQSCAARGRPRLSYRERHRKAPVKLAAAQAGPWHRPAIYRSLSVEFSTRQRVPSQRTAQGNQNNQPNYSKKAISPLKEQNFSQHARPKEDDLYTQRQNVCPKSP